VKAENKYSGYYIIYILFIIYSSLIFSKDILLYTDNMADVFIYGNTYNMLGERINVMGILMIAFPNLIMFSLFADSVAIDLEKNAVYIFTRSNKKQKWFLNKCLKIFTKLVVVDFVFMAFQLFIFRCIGFKISSIFELIIIIIKILIFKLLVQYTLILLTNVIAIKFNSIVGYSITCTIYILSIILFHTLYKYINIYNLPFTQNYAVLYILDREAYPFHNISIYGNVWWPTMCGLIYLAAIIILGNFIIKKKDFL